MELFFIGFRNVARNWRRSILNIVAIAIGVTFLIFGQGWIRGYYNTIYTGVRNFDTGDVQVLRSGYLDEQRRLPLDVAIRNYAQVATRLKADPDVYEVTPRIDFSATVSSDRGSVRVLGRAIDPETESRITVLKQFIQKGSYLQSNKGQVLIGRPLADKLGVSVGDTIPLAAVDKYSAENYIEATVAGIYYFGYPPVDDNTVYVDLATAQQLLDMPGEATRLIVKLKSGISEADGLRSIQKVVAGTQDVAYSWRSFAQAVVLATSGDIGGFKIIMVVIYLLIIIGILNSMSMSVQERTREIGTLRAIGTRRRQLIGMFLSESVWLSLFGAAVGCILGGLIVYYMETVGFDFSKFSTNDLPIPFGKRFTGDYLPIDFLFGIAVGVGTAIIGSIFPVRRASRLNIAWSLGAHIE